MTQLSPSDESWVARSIDLAERGRGRVSPNPLVGAVVVRDGEVLGEGFHGSFGGPHAEAEALAELNGGAQGATLYVSIEPCCHQGKTPPCTDAIVEAGISRVVVASEDPSEKASGRGLGILRDEGIEVVQMTGGALTTRARNLNQAFRKHARTGRPWVLFKSAMTLDGKVATRSGDSKWISGETSRRRAHRWRAECDAVAVGIGTALADDPLLTSRVEGVHRQPRRVVFDSEGRIPVNSQLVAGASELPLTVVVSRAASRHATDALELAGVDIVVAVGENEPARVASALEQLGDTGITSILLEGGPHLAGAFFDAGQVDEIRLFLAPVVLGGRSARDPLEGEGAERIADATRALSLEVESIGEDVLICARLRDW